MGLFSKQILRSAYPADNAGPQARSAQNHTSEELARMITVGGAGRLLGTERGFSSEFPLTL